MRSINYRNPIFDLPWDHEVFHNILEEVSLSFNELIFAHARFDDFFNVKCQDRSIVAIPSCDVEDSISLC
jgi:hypothetical protein